jgi:acyl-CoA thioester hydrolase
VRPVEDPPVDPDRYPFATTVRVRFAETDAMGVVHHAAYLPYLEEARVDYLDHIGHPYTGIRAEGIDLAVLEVHVKYLAPLRFDDRAEIRLRVGAARGARLVLQYLVRRGDQVVVLATTMHGALDPNGRPVRLPEFLRALDPGKDGA